MQPIANQLIDNWLAMMRIAIGGNPESMQSKSPCSCSPCRFYHFPATGLHSLYIINSLISRDNKVMWFSFMGINDKT